MIKQEKREVQRIEVQTIITCERCHTQKVTQPMQGPGDWHIIIDLGEGMVLASEFCDKCRPIVQKEIGQAIGRLVKDGCAFYDAQISGNAAKGGTLTLPEAWQNFTG